MRARVGAFPCLALLLLALLSGCQKGQPAAGNGRKTIVVTYAILSAVVSDLVGGALEVKGLIPNGLDPHEWEPSARDVETLHKADLIVENGLGLEGGMEKALQGARNAGVKVFVASEHIQVRTVGKGEGIPSGDPDQAPGAKDPHLWTDPLAVKAMAEALAARIMADLHVDLSVRAKDLAARLDGLDAEIRTAVQSIPAENRRLVTGHESMGYYARRYGLELVGAIIPSLSTQAGVSAADMSALKKLIAAGGVKAVFTEVGTPPAVADALAREAGVKAVALPTHTLPGDGSYFTFQRELTRLIVGGLR